MKVATRFITLVALASLISGCLGSIGQANREEFKRQWQTHETVDPKEAKKYEYIDEQEEYSEQKNDDPR